MKICYLILAHHKFHQAVRLVRRLNAPNVGFAFHIDTAADPVALSDFRQQLKDLKSVAFARRVRSRWGGYNQALAIMRCIQAAMQMPPFDRYVLLSGQDYPLVSQSEITRFFTDHGNEEYIETFAKDVMDASVPGWSPYYRCRRYHLWIGRRRLVVPLLRKPAPPIPMFHGSTWWALTHGALTYVCRQFQENHKLRRYLKTSFLVDELYVPSIMASSPMARSVTGDNVTFAQWTPTSGPHPKTLMIEDLPALRETPKLFARKLDAAVPGSLALMDALDRADEAQQ